jgi:hypothetical protein
VIVSPTKVTQNHMVDPSLFRVVLLPLQKIITLSLVKIRRLPYFFNRFDKYSYQRFPKNCITSNRMFFIDILYKLKFYSFHYLSFLSINSAKSKSLTANGLCNVR